MCRNVLARYAQGYFLAIALLALVMAGFLNISEDGVMWLASSPVYIASELVKAISFFFLLWHLDQRFTGFTIELPLEYALCGMFFGVATPCLFFVADALNQLMLESALLSSIFGWSEWITFVVKQVVTWIIQGAIAIAIVALIPLQRSHGSNVG